MGKFEMAMKLMSCFPGSFINYLGEFIAHREADVYFNFEICRGEIDVKCKVLEWLSRAAYKTEPYSGKLSNNQFHAFMRAGINDFLGTNFNLDDMEIIYTYLGNQCNRPLTIKFIESGYNMEILKERANG